VQAVVADNPLGPWHRVNSNYPPTIVATELGGPANASIEEPWLLRLRAGGWIITGDWWNGWGTSLAYCTNDIPTNGWQWVGPLVAGTNLWHSNGTCSASLIQEPNGDVHAFFSAKRDTDPRTGSIFQDDIGYSLMTPSIDPRVQSLRSTALIQGVTNTQQQVNFGRGFRAGYSNVQVDTNGITLGNYAVNYGANAIVIGQSAEARTNAFVGIAIGNGAKVNAAQAVVIAAGGVGATHVNTNASTLWLNGGTGISMFLNGTAPSKPGGIHIGSGDGGTANHSTGIALGNNSQGVGANSVAIGYYASAIGSQAITLNAGEELIHNTVANRILLNASNNVIVTGSALIASNGIVGTFTGNASGMTNLPPSGITDTVLTWGGPTNSIPCTNATLFYESATDVLLSTVTGSATGRKQWASLVVSNSSAGNITLRVTNALWRAIGTTTTNALVIPGSKVGLLSVECWGTFQLYGTAVQQ
jgi:hypothetical protein